MSENDLREHVSHTVLEHLRQLDQNEDFASAGDPVEALHDLRVVLRRLRAFVDAFEPALGVRMHERTRKPLRRIARALRALRDWDVQTALLTNRLVLSATDLERAAIEHLLEQTGDERHREHRLVAKRNEKLDYDAAANSVRSALDEALSYLSDADSEPSRLVLDLLEPALGKLERSHPPDDGTEHIGELHRLRLRAKKLRYSLELFEPTLGEAYSSLHERLRLLQEVLGMHHDLFVLEALVSGARAGLEERSRKTLATGLSMLSAELSRERRVTFERFRKARFTREEWRAKLEDALHLRGKRARVKGNQRWSGAR